MRFISQKPKRGWPHHRGLRPLLFSNSGVGSFTSLKNRMVKDKVLWDGTKGFSSLSEKTRKSNSSQMSLQGHQFLLSSSSVGLAGVWTCDLPLSRPVSATEVRSNDSTATRTSLKKWICVPSVLIAIIPTPLLCQKLADPPGVEFEGTISKFRKRNKISSELVYVLHKTWN